MFNHLWPDWVYISAIYVSLFLFGVLCLPLWREVQTWPARIAYRVIRRKQRRIEAQWEAKRRARMLEALR